MYRVTIFNKDGSVASRFVADEYPDDVQLEQGQWMDICRLPIEPLDYEDLDVSFT